MRVTVFGLWHLGCVTAACLAEAGHKVVGLDLDGQVVTELQHGKPPIQEPGLAELITAGMGRKALSFSTDTDVAVSDAEIVWVAFDTPVDDHDKADVAHVRRHFDSIAAKLRPGTLVLVSSQVPVGFTASLERRWAKQGLSFAVVPENLRLGKALECFRKPERIVVGCRDEQARKTLAALLEPFCQNILWMSNESAEMTKHALNAFLATSVTFINELSRICEAAGANAKDVERGLRSETRIGPGAYLSPGAAFAGGTLARDLRFLTLLSKHWKVEAPLCKGVLASNEAHKEWLRDSVTKALHGTLRPVVAVLGLTYKPGTSTLRRSSSLELCRWLHGQRITVQAHDPAVGELPADLDNVVTLCDSAAAALAGADLAVIATECPPFKGLGPEIFVRHMRCPRVIDQNHFLGGSLGCDERIHYAACGLASNL